MIQAFLLTLMIGLAAPTATIIIRDCAPPLWLLKRPFSCDLCMSWWMSIAFYVLDLFRSSAPAYNPPMVVFGATALSIITLKVINRLSEVTFGPPPE